MITADDIKKLIKDGEGLHLEVKACKDKLPKDVWETYSAFANTRGGVILLGLTEHKDMPLDQRFELTGVSDSYKVITDFFNIVNNKQKVNRSVLVDSDVRPVEVDGVTIVHIRVPEADYRQKPIYINNNLQSGTFKRMHEGDRHVTDEELAMLIRDSSDNADGQILNRYGFEFIDVDTLHGYRNAFNGHNPGHIYEKLSDLEFLRNLGGYGSNPLQQTEGLTVAGLLMFGKSVTIHQVFPNFRFDYLNLIGIEPGDSKKWNDRLTDDGRWEHNIYNFLSLALNKLLLTLPSEGKLRGVVRNDGGDLYEAVREGFINTLTYCDYRINGVLRIDRRSESIIMRNPGTLRISPERIYNGDYTQARNSTIQRMLRMVGFGDNIGSGFRKILNAWKSLGYSHPDIHEESEVNEVWLTLPLTKNENTVENSTVNSTVNENTAENSTINSTINGNKVENSTVNSTVNENSTVNSTANLTALQKDILNLIKGKPEITIEEIAVRIRKDRNAINYQIKKMKEFGIVEREGSDKTGQWRIIKEKTDL